MKINCIIDDVNISADIYTHMSLLDFIRQRKIGSEGLYCKCSDKKCMNCLCFVEDALKLSGTRELLPSCLMPAYKANGKKVTTADYFLGFEEAGDVFDAYELLKLKPCHDCLASKTMILSYIIGEYLEYENRYGGIMDARLAEEKTHLIASNMNLSSCSCLSMKNISAIVDTGMKIRRNRVV